MNRMIVAFFFGCMDISQHKDKKEKKKNGQVLDINVSRLACAFEMEWQNSTTEVIMLIILRRAKSNINLQFNQQQQIHTHTHDRQRERERSFHGLNVTKYDQTETCKCLVPM